MNASRISKNGIYRYSLSELIRIFRNVKQYSSYHSLMVFLCTFKLGNIKYTAHSNLSRQIVFKI